MFQGSKEWARGVFGFWVVGCGVSRGFQTEVAGYIRVQGAGYIRVRGVGRLARGVPPKRRRRRLAAAPGRDRRARRRRRRPSAAGAPRAAPRAPRKSTHFRESCRAGRHASRKVALPPGLDTLRGGPRKKQKRSDFCIHSFYFGGGAGDLDAPDGEGEADAGREGERSPHEVRRGLYGVRDASCPLSTRGGTRLVRLVRGKGGGERSPQEMRRGLGDDPRALARRRGARRGGDGG